jgi:hypothetical protein
MKRKPHSRRTRTTTKSVLRLPDLEHAKAAVLNSLTSPDAQRGYRHASRKAVPPGEQSRKDMGRWHDGEGGLAHCEGIRQAHRRGEVGAARSATDLCSALPCFGRRVGANPISFGGTFRCKRPNATLAANSGFDQPSMIALASSRILELGVELWKSCRQSCSYRHGETVSDAAPPWNYCKQGSWRAL